MMTTLLTQKQMIISKKPIKLIVGLRNPGSSYSKTRHNVGSWFLEELACQENLSFKEERKLKGDVANLICANLSCCLYLPLSFMNVSGAGVRAVCSFYKILPEEVLVVHDDLDLTPGMVKLKTGGGHAGHNGLRDIIACLQTKDFHRLRIGIGHPGNRELVVDYVLGKPSPDERKLIDESIVRSLEILPLIVHGDFAKAMQKLH